jgi:AcrR family transcriptional regulator
MPGLNAARRASRPRRAVGQTVPVTERNSGGRAEATRAALLAAALEVFSGAGYADANITAIVDRAGSSVGSLYHHFGGKPDLYIALYDDYQARQQRRAAKAFRTALAAGETDALRLFIAATRAYLDGCWEERQLARLFLSGGGPPGFDLLTRRQFRRWLRTNVTLLDDQAHPLSDALILVLTTIASEAGREVAVQSSKARARKFIDEIIDLMGNLCPPR